VGGILAINVASAAVRPVVQRGGCVSAALLGISRDGSTLGFVWVNSVSRSGSPATVRIDGSNLQTLPKPPLDVANATLDQQYATTAAIYLP
jgi:hypothetical protein